MRPCRGKEAPGPAFMYPTDAGGGAVPGYPPGIPGIAPAGTAVAAGQAQIVPTTGAYPAPTAAATAAAAAQYGQYAASLAAYSQYPGYAGYGAYGLHPSMYSLYSQYSSLYGYPQATADKLPGAADAAADAVKPSAAPDTSTSGNKFMPGDWMCPQCNDHVFARNSACRRCGATKPDNPTDPSAAAAAFASSGGGLSRGGGSQRVSQPGDWTCPQCKDLQFARNKQCRMCRCPRPESGGFDLRDERPARPAGGRGRSRSRSGRRRGRSRS